MFQSHISSWRAEADCGVSVLSKPSRLALNRKPNYSIVPVSSVRVQLLTERDEFQA